MLEAGYWSDRVKPRLERESREAGFRFHLERVENLAGTGTPDVDYLIGGIAGKVELKYAPRHPARDETQVLGKGKGMRRSQIVYAARHTWAGGLCWCLVGTPDADWLLDLRSMTPEDMAGIATMSPSDLRKRAAWRREGRFVVPTPLACVLRAL